MVVKMGILKLFCAVVFFAFIAQVFITRAEHSGLIECHVVCTESGEKAPSSPEKDSSYSLHCCCNTASAPCQMEFELDLSPSLQVSFKVLDEVIPVGPIKTIDVPPQLLG